MKVIDLLNKIANGEEVPRKIKSYQGQIYLYEDDGEYVCLETQDLLFDFPGFRQLGDYLNDEVEIIEEDKKIEKMIPLNNVSGASDLVALSTMQWENNLKIERKINEIIDYLEENKK